MSEWIVTVEDSLIEQRLKDFLAQLPGVRYAQKQTPESSPTPQLSLEAFKQRLEPYLTELPEPLRNHNFSREWIYPDNEQV